MSGSAAFSDTLTRGLSYAVGVGYFYRGVYDRLADAPSEYDPGDMVVATAGADFGLRAGILRADLGVVYYLPESENGSETYQHGSEVTIKVAHIGGLSNLHYRLQGYDVVGLPDKCLDGEQLMREPENSHGNRGGLEISGKCGIGQRFTVEAIGGMREEMANGYEKGLPQYRGRKVVGDLGLRVAAAPFGFLWVELGGRYYRGSVGERFAFVGGMEIQGVEADIGLTVRF